MNTIKGAAELDTRIGINKLAKARKTRTSPSTLGLKKFRLGNLWVKKVFGKYTFKNSTFNKYTFRKCTFGKYTFKKYTFGKYTFKQARKLQATLPSPKLRLTDLLTH